MDGNEEMSWTLEVVVVPVSDVDRAKAFYQDQLGFTLDHDYDLGEGRRIIQLTPPGSGCSIVMGSGDAVAGMPPGSMKGLQLVVPDVERAHRILTERGVETGGVQVLGENPGPTAHPLAQVRRWVSPLPGREGGDLLFERDHHSTELLFIGIKA